MQEDTYAICKYADYIPLSVQCWLAPCNSQSSCRSALALVGPAGDLKNALAGRSVTVSGVTWQTVPDLSRKKYRLGNLENKGWASPLPTAAQNISPSAVLTQRQRPSLTRQAWCLVGEQLHVGGAGVEKGVWQLHSLQVLTSHLSISLVAPFLLSPFPSSPASPLSLQLSLSLPHSLVAFHNRSPYLCCWTPLLLDCCKLYGLVFECLSTMCTYSTCLFYLSVSCQLACWGWGKRY